MKATIRFASALSILGGLAVVHPAAAAGFPAQHFCLTGTTPICATLLAIKTPDWTKSQDIIVLPHRGYWGFGDVADTPENSLPGYRAVSGHGYPQTEVDFTPTADNPLQTVMSHDYALNRTTNYDYFDRSRIYTYQFNASTLEDFLLRDRFGQVTPNAMVKGQVGVTVLNQLGTVAFVDIKQQPNADPNLYALNWLKAASAILRATPDDQTLSTLVFKVPYTPAFIRANLDPDVASRFYKVLWMPQVGSDSLYAGGTAPGVGTAAHSSADFVDVWGQDAVSVAAFEVNYKDTDDSRLQVFTRGGVSYANLLDYIKQSLSYRGGVFSEEPIGPRGVPNRLAIWGIKNTTTDRRGDYLFEAVTPKWGNFIVVTTDRPDIWAQVKSNLYPPASGAAPQPAARRQGARR